MIHVISDISMHYFDKDPEQHVIDPECEYIILAGNICDQNKRTMLYSETLAKMYPKSKIIFNFGVLESTEGLFDRIKDGYYIHINDFKQSPVNLYYPQGTIIGNYDFYCTIGWPTITKLIDFENSFVGQEIFIDMTEELYIDDILVTKDMTRTFTPEHINLLKDQEECLIKEWLELDQGKQKILITSFSDWSNKFLGISEYKIFPNLDLNNIIWISSSDREFIGSYRNSKFISLPGRDRSKYISEDTMDLIVQQV